MRKLLSLVLLALACTAAQAQTKVKTKVKAKGPVKVVVKQPLKPIAKPTVAQPQPQPAPTPAPAASMASATAAVAGAAIAIDDWNGHYAELITAKGLNQHLAVLASDAYEGRETGEKGQHMAAAYVAQQFKAAGLSGPVKAADPYLQKFMLEHVSWKATPTLTVGGTAYKWLVDFYGRGDAGFQQETTVQPVFVGYGIEQPGYSDYTDRDVKGKDLLMLEGEPTTAEGTALLGENGNPSRWGQDFRAKAALAAAKGARSVFFVNFNPRSNFAKLASRLAPTIAKPGIAMAGEKADRAPSFFISPAVGYKLLGLSEAETQAYLAKTVGSKAPLVFPTKILTRFKIKAAKVRAPFGTENAVGYVEGTDKKDEVLVISAHHDHLGIIDGKVYNGADDDGSGTTSIINIAEAFARAKAEGHGPRRSLLFLSVTGEEEGLYGSEYYAGHPIFPLANTVADLNVDMVGRTDPEHEGKPDYVYVIGSDKLASQLKMVLETQNAQYEHLELDYKFDDPNDPNRFYYRSDHYNFAVKKIPVAFFFNGVHDDYHQATDEIEKIQFDKMEKRARLVFHTAWALANRDERLVVDSDKP